jgi:DNA-binding XRE family transcriptional regulator
MAVTGPDLRRERRLAEITATEIAKRMGVSRFTVHNLEKAAVLTVERELQYRRCLSDAIVAARERVA